MSRFKDELDRLEKILNSQPWPKEFEDHVKERISHIANPIQRDDGTYVCPKCSGTGHIKIMEDGSDGKPYQHGEHECYACGGWGSV